MMMIKEGKEIKTAIRMEKDRTRTINIRQYTMIINNEGEIYITNNGR